MGEQSGAGHGAGAESRRESSPPASPPLAGFADGGEWDACPPSAGLAAATAAASGPEWRCPGATDDQLVGLLRRWAAIESWAAAGRLGVIREMMRREDTPWLPGNRHGDLPDAWSESLEYEMAAALAVSVQSVSGTAQLAWDLQARLPGIGAKLAGGTLSYVKAMLIAKELSVLTEDDAAAAEALILDRLAETPALTPGQLARLAAQTVVTVDPDGAERRRQTAERLDIRVRLWREQSGAAGLAGRNLPTDEALAAYASVAARTAEYQASKAFPDATTDQLRAMAYLDLLNGVTAHARIRQAQTTATATATAERDPDDAGKGGSTADGRHDDESPPDGCSGFGPGGPGPAGGDPDSGPGGRGPDEQAEPPRAAELVTPLSDLLGLASLPGECHGLGPLDPALCRDLAALAAHSLRSEWCVTIVDKHGFAIGHGCARLAAGDRASWKSWAGQPDAHRGLRGRSHVRMRPCPRVACLPAERHPPSPRPGPRRHLHIPVLLPPRQGLGFRARPPIRPGREDVRVQRGRPVKEMPPRQAVARLERHPAQARLASVAGAERQVLHPRTQAVPGVRTGWPQATS
jgi:hypothetical protein